MKHDGRDGEGALEFFVVAAGYLWKIAGVVVVNCIIDFAADIDAECEADLPEYADAVGCNGIGAEFECEGYLEELECIVEIGIFYGVGYVGIKF